MTDLATGLSEADEEVLTSVLGPFWSTFFYTAGHNTHLKIAQLFAAARAQGPRQDGEFVPGSDVVGAAERLHEIGCQPADMPWSPDGAFWNDLLWVTKFVLGLSASPVPTLPEVGETARELSPSAEKATPKSAATWLPIETAPKDRPILAWCNHEADPWAEDDGKTLTLYAAHREGLGHAPTGAHILVWGGAWDDRTYEFDGGHLPDWWFVAGSEFEVAANPTHWMPLPAEPADGEGRVPSSTADASQASVRTPNPSSLNKGEGR